MKTRRKTGVGILPDEPVKHKKRRWRSALIGCGCIAPMHVQSLARMDYVDLVAVVDPLIDQARSIAEIWKADTLYRDTSEKPAVYETIEQMLSEIKPDLVHICTPHHLHAVQAAEALSQGCHVLLEKPCGISLDDIERLHHAGLKSGRQIGLCFQNRYNKASLDAWVLMQSGLMGQVKGGRAILMWNRDQTYYNQADWRGRWHTEGGGVMINQAIHTLDLLLWLTGRPVRVNGQYSQRRDGLQIEVEDTAECLIELDNGAKTSFYATNAYVTDAPPLIEVLTDAYRLKLEGDSFDLFSQQGHLLTASQKDELLIHAARILEEKCSLSDQAAASASSAFWLKTWRTYGADSNQLTQGPAADKAYWGQGHARLIASFYDSLDEWQPGRSVFPIDQSEGSIALRALLALYESHRQHQTVDL